MSTRHKQTGLSLIEMAVVIAIIALLATLGMPAVRALLGSFESASGTSSIISSSLASARAIAASEQRYAGIRFQQDLNGEQYIIFIVHSPEETGLGAGFRAVEAQKPIKLPTGSLLCDLRVRVNHDPVSDGAEDTSDTPLLADYLDDTNPRNLGSDGENIYLTDASSFSIIFSPNGNLIIHNVRVRNKDGIYQPDNSVSLKFSDDDVFNSPENIRNFGVGKFIQDDYAQLGFGAEPSRNMFIIYDATHFDKLNAQGRFDYLKSLEPVYINPYTGTVINRL